MTQKTNSPSDQSPSAAPGEVDPSGLMRAADEALRNAEEVMAANALSSRTGLDCAAETIAETQRRTRQTIEEAYDQAANAMSRAFASSDKRR